MFREDIHEVSNKMAATSLRDDGYGGGAPALNSSPGFNSTFSDEYAVIEILGKGGFGIVYKAQHKLVNVSYAVKMIPLSSK
jgi:serine/threonine protein kinase